MTARRQNLNNKSPQRLRRDVAAEMRAAETDFAPVAAGVLACRRAGASRPAE